jgi:DNA-3-methyladenine glycosylase
MATMHTELATILSGPATEVAPRLLGASFISEGGGRRLSGRIVETEAYDQTDAASHSYKGRTPRTDIMFGPPGHLYVYFTYGMHYCCNVVTGEEGYGSAVLIRAVEPLEGEVYMLASRRGRGGYDMTNGPAKVCQAFGIDKTYNGHDLRRPPIRLELHPPVPQTDIVQTTRIGISQAKDVPWRWYIAGNPYVSKP